jgi:hypothetical protein
MPRSTLTVPFAEVTYLFPTLVHCPICNILQSMHVKGAQPGFIAAKTRSSINARSAEMKHQNGCNPRRAIGGGIK